MIYLKIIALIISIGAGLIRVGLDYKWHDKRTNKHKLIKNILVVLMILGLLFMPFVVWYDQQQAEKVIKDAINREKQAISERKQITDELNRLQKQIQPIIEIAIEKYPNLKIEEALVYYSRSYAQDDRGSSI